MWQWLSRSAVDPEVEREFMRAMVARASQSITANLVGVAILLLGCFMVPFGRPLALALGLRIIAICITAANTRELVRRIDSHRPLGEAVNRVALGMIFAGVTWGGLLWAIPADQFVSLSATLVRMVVMTGVVLVTLTAAPVPKVMLAFWVSFMSVAGAHLLYLSGAYGLMPFVVALLVFVGVIAFGIGMTREAHAAARTLVDNQNMARALAGLNEDLGAALEKADRLARFDPLTALPNRFSFEEHCAAADAARVEHRRYHVLLLDLDHFKAINDSVGHDGGDRVLSETGRALADLVRGLPDGTMAARIGGEEFAVYLPHVDEAGAAAVGALICDRVRHIAPPNGFGGRVTTSVGIASWPAGESLHHALKRADGALYRAKAAGRNRVAEDRRVA